MLENKSESRRKRSTKTSLAAASATAQQSQENSLAGIGPYGGRIQFGIRVQPKMLTYLRLKAIADSCTVSDLITDAVTKVYGEPPADISPARVRRRLIRRSVAAA